MVFFFRPVVGVVFFHAIVGSVCLVDAKVDGFYLSGGPILVGALAVAVSSRCFRVFGRGSGFVALSLERPLFADGVFWGWGWGWGSPLAGHIRECRWGRLGERWEVLLLVLGGVLWGWFVRGFVLIHGGFIYDLVIAIIYVVCHVSLVSFRRFFTTVGS